MIYAHKYTTTALTKGCLLHTRGLHLSCIKHSASDAFSRKGLLESSPEAESAKVILHYLSEADWCVGHVYKNTRIPTNKVTPLNGVPLPYDNTEKREGGAGTNAHVASNAYMTRQSWKGTRKGTVYRHRNDINLWSGHIVSACISSGILEMITQVHHRCRNWSLLQRNTLIRNTVNLTGFDSTTRVHRTLPTEELGPATKPTPLCNGRDMLNIAGPGNAQEKGAGHAE